MKIEVTNSQRMALCTLISDYMRMPETIERFVDCSIEPVVETTPPELLNLFMDAPASAELCECGVPAEDCSSWDQGIAGHGYRVAR